MTEKKKINLGPLPEEIDFSKYEETVTRWDRIIGVLLVAFLLLAVPVYLFWPETEQAGEPSVPLVESQSSTLEDKESSVDSLTASQEEALPANTAVETEQMEAAEQLPVLAESGEQSQSAGPGATSEQPLIDTANETVAQVPQATPEMPVLNSDSPAELTILNAAIKQAILTLEMNNNEPGAALPAELVLPASGITKVILFTEMQGLRGKTLYHEWYRNGVRQARVKIPVNIENQRSFSSKFINTQMTGDWQVKVVGAKSAATYVEAAFKVLAP